MNINNLVHTREGGNVILKGADMGKVTKTVIEDIAYQLKRVGVLTHAFNNGLMPENSDYEDLDNPEEVLDWVIVNIEDVFIEHDPTFNVEKFRQQCHYKPDNLV